eukprot:6468-Pelagococcus_subviridis.AAC.1
MNRPPSRDSDGDDAVPGRALNTARSAASAATDSSSSLSCDCAPSHRRARCASDADAPAPLVAPTARQCRATCEMTPW